jgi:ATP-dependent exoDNAse (exonuclease V) alpha subunit
MFNLTPEQELVAASAGRFLADASGRYRTFTVQGLAGTGKTHVLAELARRYPAASLAAPTGKAAAVLRGRVGRDVRTVHSLVYDFRGLSEDESTGRVAPIFTSKEDAGLGGLTVFLDEASMAGCRMAEDLLATGCRVVAFGDPGQLPPVADEPFFDRPDRTLTEVHRQALESAIVRQAHRVRRGLPYAADGPDFRVQGGATDDDHRAADVALCWKNRTRQALNQRRRRVLRGLTDTVLRAGEPVMCLRNDYRLGVFNGETYPLARDREPGGDVLLDLGEGRVVEVLNAVVEGFDSDFETLRHEEERSPFALAYAVTVHRAQGSEWNRILLIDEYRRNDGERNKWVYTAITRARSSCTILRR